MGDRAVAAPDRARPEVGSGRVVLALLTCVALLPSVVLSLPVGLVLAGQLTAAGLLLAAIFDVRFPIRLVGPGWSLITVATWIVGAGVAFRLAGMSSLDQSVAQLLATGATVASALAILLSTRPTGNSRAVLALAVVAATTAAALGLSAPLTVDVLVFLRDGAAALLDGGNPYAMTFTSPYTAEENRVFYGPGVIDGHRIDFGFPYPPIVLLAASGSALLGDPRLVFALALSLAGVVLARQTTDLRAPTVLILLPGYAFVAGQGWLEPLSLLLLVAAVCGTMSGSRLGPVWLGLLLASKQYFVVALPLVWLLLPVDGPDGRRRAGRYVLTAAGTGALSVLPFVLWEPRAFWRSVVELHLRQPFREDSSSIAAWSVTQLGWPSPSLLGPLSVGAGLLVAVALARWAPRTPASFCLSLALTMLVLVSCSKQAFSNYWFLVAGAAVVGGCLLTARTPSVREEQSPGS